LFIFSIFFIGKVNSQVDFKVPDTICAGVPFTPEHNINGVSSYFWHFCSGNLSYVPSIMTVTTLAEPAFIDVAEDKGNFYGFVTNTRSRNIVRLNFGNSLRNNPTTEDTITLGGMIPDHIEGIQIDSSDGKWYGFTIGGLGDDDRLIRIDFGDSLTSNPTATNLGNIGNYLDYPVDFYLFKEGNMWVGFTVNYLGNSVTRFKFENGLSQPPTADNLGIINQLYNPFGICPIKDESGWHFFITNSGKNSITRLDFSGSLLSNNIVVNQLAASSLLNTPYDLAIIKDCERTFGFVASTHNGELIRLDFPDGLTGTIVYTSLGKYGMSQPHGMTNVYRVDNEIFTFVTDMGNRTLNKLYYQTCDQAYPVTSTERSPGAYYQSEGNYNISLILDQGLPTEKFVCKNIMVLPKPEVSLGKDTTICPNSSATFDAKEGYTSYLWNNNETTQTITADTTGMYWVEVTNTNNCKDRDTILLSHYQDLLFLGNDTFFTLGESIVLDAGTGYTTYSWSTGAVTNSIAIIKPGTYAVAVKQATDTAGSEILYCIYADTINVKLFNDLPNFVTPNSDGYNDVWLPKLFYHYPEAEITILDRYGKTIARFNGSDPGWDGTYNGKLVNPDTYWYVVDLKDGSKPITGSITVKR
jgi:gliding motility-associated-like protein